MKNDIYFFKNDFDFLKNDYMHFIKKIKNSNIIKMNLGNAAFSSNENRNQPDGDI
jgi:hypothetical protein